MAWNFRVLHDPDHETPYRMIEAYYGNEGWEITSWSEAHPPGGDTLWELSEDISLRHTAAQKSQLKTFRWRVLELSDLPRANPQVSTDE
jgi:hypothetical protein